MRKKIRAYLFKQQSVIVIREISFPDNYYHHIAILKDILEGNTVFKFLFDYETL